MRVRRTQRACELHRELAVAFGLLAQKVELVLLVATIELDMFTSGFYVYSQEPGASPYFFLVKRHSI